MNKIVTFGELMLRLKSIGKERFLQTPFLEASFGGSEANVAVSLANFGKKVSFVSAFPDNYFGKQAEMSLKKFGVEVESVLGLGTKVTMKKKIKSHCENDEFAVASIRGDE